MTDAELDRLERDSACWADREAARIVTGLVAEARRLRKAIHEIAGAVSIYATLHGDPPDRFQALVDEILSH